MDESIGTKLFNEFMFFLKKMTYHNTGISAGVICQDKSKYTLVCYTDKELSQNQLNSVTNFSKQPPQKNDVQSEWKDFNLSIVNVGKDIYCYIFATCGGIKNLATETSKLIFLLLNL